MKNKSELKQTRKMLRTACKFVALKMDGVHPTREEIIKFAEKYRNLLTYTIYREWDEDNPFDDDYPEYASYEQYITLNIESSYSETSISISTLPYPELYDILKISDFEFQQNEMYQDDEYWDEIEDNNNAYDKAQKEKNEIENEFNQI